MSEIAKAYVQIVPSAKGIKGSVSNILKPESESAGKSSGTSIATALGSSLKSALVGLGIGAFIKDTFFSSAELEQTVGGIETLFKDSSSKMVKYSQDAYKTAGIDANTYMQQATSFSASLLQSLGGDTEKAAEASNKAIIDMADNANKMGSSLESIQSAYQGFAKGQYQLLDNLKLGYGGTKTEMERLLSDAEKITGTKYDIDNLGDVYDAIHVIQEELGITGTTAKEAEKTFSGSFGMMKESAKNLIASLGGVKQENGEVVLSVQESMNNLIDSASTFFFGNFIPMLGNVIVSIPSALGTGFVKAMPIVIEQGKNLLNWIIDGITNDLPLIIENGGETVASFIEGLLNNYSKVYEQGGNMINRFLEAVIRLLPSVLNAGAKIINSIVQGLANNFPSIMQKGVELIIKLAQTILNNLPTIIQTGFQIITFIGSGLIQAIPTLVAQIPSVISAIKNAFLNVDWWSIGMNIINGIKDGITGAIRGLVDSGIQACKSLTSSVKSFFGIKSPSRLFKNEIGKNIALGMALGITDNMDFVNDAMGDLEKGTIGVINSDLKIASSGKVSNAANLKQVVKLLEYIASNPTIIKLNGREVGRSLDKMGVA